MSRAGLGFVVASTAVGAFTGLAVGMWWMLKTEAEDELQPDPKASPAYCTIMEPNTQPCGPGFVCGPGLLHGICVSPAVASAYNAKQNARVVGPLLGGALLGYLATARPWER